MNVKDLLEKAVQKNAADIFIVAGLPVSYRIGGVIVQDDDLKLTPSQTSEFLKQIYELHERDMERELGIPQNIIHTGDLPKGMVLVTGPAGSGKSTTLACIIDYINKHKQKHIITLEDPIEYLHRHDHCIVSQREINIDTESYVTALRASLRQSPDVILLGEMRDYETIEVAMTAAETGHLIFSTLHTLGAANTIERIIDVFPAAEKHRLPCSFR